MWLALEIGNSRLHWAWFIGETLIYAWDTNYLPVNVVQQLAQCQTLEDLPTEIFPFKSRSEGENQSIWEKILPLPFSPPLALLLSSVVPSQTELWQNYPIVRVITLDQIPLHGMYPTLGIDRALALWGAGQRWGFPMLVIDGGTALTFTGADANYCLVGGAILPGLRLQLTTLFQRTGQLPKVEPPQQLPQRYALNTQEAIHSGVIYTLLAGIKDFVEVWWDSFPESKIAITGGDRTFLINYLQSQFPTIAAHIEVEPNLRFWGMREIFRIHKFLLTPNS
jgi:type III pantothenate kinase